MPVAEIIGKAVPTIFISSNLNDTAELLLNLILRFEVAGIVPVADFNVHVLAVMVELTVSAVKFVPSVLYSNVSIELAVEDNTPKLKEILV